MSDTLIKSSKRNRGIQINWPDGQFTFRDVVQGMKEEEKLSNVAVQLRINSALEKNILVKIDGKMASSRGRPATLYQKAN